jgi:hypothetical protein
MKRRQFLATGSLALAGCRSASREIDGGFTGIGFERGHRLRPASSGAPGTGQVPPGEGRPTGSPGATRRVHTLIAGGGVAGLAAARALRQRGIDDFVVLELEDSAGGNSRGGQVNGIACPLGAHYLPVPGDEAPRGAGSAGRAGPAPASGRAAGNTTSATCATARRSAVPRRGMAGGPAAGAGCGRPRWRSTGALPNGWRRPAATPFAMPAFRAPASAAHLALDAIPSRPGWTARA